MKNQNPNDEMNVRETAGDRPDPDSLSKDSGNEIDDFARKLLDKQAEMALFPDDDNFTTSALEGSLSEAQRKNAETSMLNALDQLRMERGQETIEEEEQHYAAAHPQEEKKKHTSSSAHHKKSSSAHTAHKAGSSTASAAGLQKETAPKKPSYTSIEPGRYETTTREDHFEVQEKRPNPKKFYQKPRFWIVMCIVLLLAAMFGTYAWKVTVYDPQHATDVEQSHAYNRLVNYADEYPMMSQAQRREIVSLEADYTSLPSGRQKEINEYFENPKHVGKSFDALLAEVKQAITNEDSAHLQPLLEYAGSWDRLDEATRHDIVNRLDAYNSLSASGKAQVDDLLMQKAGKNFMEIYNETKAGLEGTSTSAASSASPSINQNNGNANTNAAQQPQNSSQPSSTPAQQPAADQPAQTYTGTPEELQAELNQLIADRDSYLEFLEDEGDPADEILNQYNLQIAELQGQLGY